MTTTEQKAIKKAVENYEKSHVEDCTCDQCFYEDHHRCKHCGLIEQARATLQKLIGDYYQS